MLDVIFQDDITSTHWTYCLRLSVLLFYPDDYGLEECWSGDEFIDVVVI